MNIYVKMSSKKANKVSNTTFSSSSATYPYEKKTITITYGDQAENHRGMQIIGTRAEKGFSLDDITFAQTKFESEGCVVERIDLKNYLPEELRENAEDAHLLIIRGGVNHILRDRSATVDDMFNEQLALEYDSKAYMYGRVVNKNARHNLCFGDESQEPDYQEGKGRIVSFSEIPLTNHIREKLGEYIEGGANLQAEGNYYYDVTKCGIGFHGDSERLKVIALRLGESIPIHYQWFVRSSPVGQRGIFNLNHGDMYIMSEKTTGYDWKKKVIPTLRHATGCDKFTTI